MIYLDNCATTKVRPEVRQVILDSLEKDFANPSSLHSFGMKAEEKLEESRKIIGDFLAVKAEEIFFTSGGTESNNTFISSAIEKNKKYGKKLITTELEHDAVLEVFKKYESLGYQVYYLNCDEYGRADLDQLSQLMDDQVILVSIIHVNNELGSINNIKKAVEIIREKNKKTLIHSDGVQAFGKIKVNLKDLGVDGYSVSSHKVHGPKGTGALYVKKGLNLDPFILGGGQESGFRSGTENTNSIFAFAKAVEILERNFDKELAHKQGLKDQVLAYIKNIDDVVINSPEESPSAIVNLSFLDTRGEVILHYLEQDQIYISTTSACHSNRKSKTNLEKIGKDPKVVDGSIRLCFSYENTKEDIEIFLDKLKFAVEDIRKITTKRKR
ncbi:MAG: cysteine desulfurase family protein [Bacillota bacterium]|nr:cysteine desulfurase family protein [Bacillota bacterium]